MISQRFLENAMKTLGLSRNDCLQLLQVFRPEETEYWTERDWENNGWQLTKMIEKMIQEMLRKAVLGKNLVEFYYEGGTKVIEPHMVAYNRNGHILLHGWFVRGDQKFGEEAWQDYMLVGVTKLKVLPENFAGPRFGYNPFGNRNYSCIEFCL